MTPHGTAPGRGGYPRVRRVSVIKNGDGGEADGEEDRCGDFQRQRREQEGEGHREGDEGEERFHDGIEGLRQKPGSQRKVTRRGKKIIAASTRRSGVIAARE